MDNLNDLKKIWLSVDTSTLPNAEEMKQAIRKYRYTRLVKKAMLILAAIFLTCAMIFLVFWYRSVMISTRIGEGCIIIAGAVLVTTNIRSLGRLYRLSDGSNKEFIAYLLQVQVNRAYYHNKTQVICLWLLSAGLLLYVYEGVASNALMFILAYAFVLAYLIVVWFVLRPRAYKRQTRKLEETIKKMKRLADQF